ncbi:MAG: carbon storage regulator [Planctomycetota bacterium]
MLVLSRKSSQTIRINDQIVITILRVKGRSVQVGIEAPQHLQILRGELIQQALAEAGDPQALAASDQQAVAEPNTLQACGETPETDVWEDFAALYTADGDVSSSFIDPDENEDLPVQTRQSSNVPSTRILPLRRLERRFPMGVIQPAVQR